jgi:hypothetical protein
LSLFAMDHHDSFTRIAVTDTLPLLGSNMDSIFFGAQQKWTRPDIQGNGEKSRFLFKAPRVNGIMAAFNEVGVALEQWDDTAFTFTFESLPSSPMRIEAVTPPRKVNTVDGNSLSPLLQKLSHNDEPESALQEMPPLPPPIQRLRGSPSSSPLRKCAVRVRAASSGDLALASFKTSPMPILRSRAKTMSSAGGKGSGRLLHTQYQNSEINNFIQDADPYLPPRRVVQVLTAWNGTCEQHLTLEVGDVILVDSGFSPDSPHWHGRRALSTTMGFFPNECVQIMRASTTLDA